MAALPDSEANFKPPPYRGIIVICVMIATLMQALDSTVAVVALPYMQGSLAATSTEIDWVLTSFVIGAAIMTAPSGWLSNKFGRKNVLIVSISGFTLFSVLCGMSTGLNEIVLFRFVQGLFGSQLVPLAQSILLDIFPSSQRGRAMAMWGMGVMIGPILGPTLGGYLTEIYSWRYVFYINVPFGILALLGLIFFMKQDFKQKVSNFDWTGFLMLAIAVTALQLILNKGQQLNWFASKVILGETIVSGLAFYLFIVHMGFSKGKAFISTRLFRDVNITSGFAVMGIIGVIILATSALLAPYLQTLGNYPVATAGLVMAPRGIGTIFAMIVVGRLADRFDPRILMSIGALSVAWSLFAMTGWQPSVSEWQIVAVNMVQGFGLGFVFVPLQVIAFATLDPKLRPDASGVMNLCRNIGSAVGTSVVAVYLVRNSQTLHDSLGSFITPFAPAFHWASPLVTALLDPQKSAAAAVRVNALLNRQALIIAYSDDFKLLGVMTLLLIIIFLLMKRVKHRLPPGEKQQHFPE